MYAPYFGLDIKNMRQWFECQFTSELSWETFGKNWQFDHIIPVAYFDYEVEEDLFLCWNFTNLKAAPMESNNYQGHRADLLLSKKYFEALYASTGYEICKKLLQKIEQLAFSGILDTEVQKKFINKHMDYLRQIGHFSFFEFELLNSDRTIEEVQKEAALLKGI